MNDLMATRKQNRYVLTPIVSEYSKYSIHFENEETYLTTEKKLGNFLLIPNPISIDFITDTKISKINKLKQELKLSKSMTPFYYIGAEQSDYLISKGFTEFNDFKTNIDERTLSLNNIIKEIWDIEKI